MRVKRWLLAGIALCLLTGMRDPFKPPEDLCRISELSQWRYQGMVGRGERIIGVIKDGQKKWRRVQQNDVLENGGNDSNLLIVFYVQIMPDDFVMQL
ncbi:DUF2531 family protein, partial [Escherichia coli]|nr:DUF2531 family protein [Escherichia coli]